MASDTYLLIGLGCVALFVVWLVFSLVKKLFGIALLIGVVIAGFVVWNNPDLQRAVIEWISGFMGRR